MIKNTGIPYEILTQSIFNEIVNQDLVETTKVEHDITLEGKTTSHQIDVYWEFKIGGVEYSTIVQCKDWKNAVSQEHLLTFKAVIDDLPNHPKGIFVTKMGYQSGAKQFAERNGIELFVLRNFTKEDEQGRVKIIELTIDSYIPSSHIISIEHDNDWLSNFMETNNIDKKIQINLCGDTKEIFLYNEKKEMILSLYNKINTLFPKDYIELQRERKQIDFKEPVYINTSSPEIPFLKITKIIVDIEVKKIVTKDRYEFDDVISFILKNVLTDEEQLIKDNLTLLK